MKFFPAYPAERCVLNGKVNFKVVLWLSVYICVMCSWTLRQSAFVRHHQNRAELGPMPSWVVWMVAGEFLGSGRRPREGWAPVSLTSPLFDEAVLADVEIGKKNSMVI